MLLDAPEKIHKRLGPDRDDITQAAVSAASATTHTIIAAPAAGSRIVVIGWWIRGEAVNRFEWKIGATSYGDDAYMEAYRVYQDRGTTSSPVFRLPEATPLQLVTQAADLVSGYVTYFVEEVG